eukprot:447640-Prymnesium_polylepis.1
MDMGSHGATWPWGHTEAVWGHTGSHGVTRGSHGVTWVAFGDELGALEGVDAKHGADDLAPLLLFEGGEEGRAA